MNKLWILFASLLCLSSVYAEAVDPTRPPEFAYSSQFNEQSINTVWELSAIFISPRKKVALINGQTVKEGDQIMGAAVLSIEPNVVQLEGSGGRITWLLWEKIRKPS